MTTERAIEMFEELQEEVRNSGGPEGLMEIVTEFFEDRGIDIEAFGDAESVERQQMASAMIGYQKGIEGVFIAQGAEWMHGLLLGIRIAEERQVEAFAEEVKQEL